MFLLYHKNMAIQVLTWGVSGRIDFIVCRDYNIRNGKKEVETALKHKNIQPIPLLLWGILGVCLLGIFRINLAGDPILYQTDMYTDMMVAVRMWETSSLFPEGWVFGNQLYVLATPVLAAVFYALTSDMMLAMGLASCVMTVLVLLSFAWMLRDGKKALLGCVLLVSLSFLVGDPVYSMKGWQLFFTMCSYYSCYLIAAFLAFGCYVRSCEGKPCGLVLACVLAFAMGIQSLRQTAVMICPLLAVEGCRTLYRLVKKEKLWSASLLTVCALTAANVLGLVTAKLLPIAQVEIFGGIGLNGIGELLRSIVPAVQTALSMLVPGQYTLLLWGVAVVGVPLWCLVLYVTVKACDRDGTLYLLLFTVSPLVILAIDILTTMAVRDIYYFMLIPMAAVAAVLLYAHGGKYFRSLVLLGTVGLFGLNCLTGLLTVPENKDSERYADVAASLVERGITTVYSPWNCGEQLALASGGDIAAGFWDRPSEPFQSMQYLCDPDVFDVDAEKCAYVFLDAHHADLAMAEAANRGAELIMLVEYLEDGWYIGVADVNLME